MEGGSPRPSRKDLLRTLAHEGTTPPVEATKRHPVDCHDPEQDGHDDTSQDACKEYATIHFDGDHAGTEESVDAAVEQQADEPFRPAELGADKEKCKEQREHGTAQPEVCLMSEAKHEPRAHEQPPCVSVGRTRKVRPL